MNIFLKMNKNLVIYFLILLLALPIFGFNFLINILGNILLLVILIPILLLLIALISLNFLKSKLKTCNNCGTISLGINQTCINCGSDLDEENIKNFEELKRPSETTIEVKAEEIN